MPAKLTLSLLIALLAIANSATLYDYLELDDVKKLVEVPEQRNTQPNRNCMCKGPACICCVDFNTTFVDLGGPGCVHMKYLSPDDGFSVNVSYGKSLIHSSKIKGTNPPPICLQVLGKFAQVCAKFNDLAPTADGLRGCLELGPKLFGETQLELPIGCFKSTAGGMEMDDPPAEAEETETDDETTTEGSNNETGEFDAESFLLGVYQTAEQGMAFLSSLLDIPKQNASNAATTVQKPELQSRGPKNLRHPNLL